MSKAKDNNGFDNLYNKLKRLVAEIEGEDLPLESLKEKIVAARALVKECEQKLRNIEDELNTNEIE